MKGFGMIMKCFFVPFLLFSVLITSCMGNQSKLFVSLKPENTGVLFNNHIEENDSINILDEEYVFNGGGVLAADFDNNGLVDLFFTGNQVSNRLYLNKGNFQFEDISSQAQIEAKKQWAKGTTEADINGDGY